MTEEQIIAKGDELLQSKDLDKRIFQRLIVYVGQHTEGGIVNISDEDLDSIFKDTPSCAISSKEITDGINIDDLLSKTPLFKSKGEAKRAIQQNGVYLNNVLLNSIDYKI